MRPIPVIPGRAEGANPESRYKFGVLVWIPGPAPERVADARDALTAPARNDGELFEQLANRADGERDHVDPDDNRAEAEHDAAERLTGGLDLAERARDRKSARA